MKIYQDVKRFSAKTGKPSGTKRELKEIRCDYTGVILSEDLDENPYPTYHLDYGSSDPCFGSGGDEYEFGEKYSVDMFPFLSDEYVFNDSSYQKVGACAAMIKHFAGGEGACSFADMCRISRIETAKRLIENGTIIPIQINE